MKDRVEVKKNFRDEEGAVITGPRNFTTNPEKGKLIAVGETGKLKALGGNFPAFEAKDDAKANARKEFEAH
jgi:co-chaperonin GroES (HSP10)